MGIAGNSRARQMRIDILRGSVRMVIGYRKLR
jgi:hypothetical protein